MAKNKKIKNATSDRADDIVFKSKMEKMIYRALRANGITPEYEKYTFVLWDGFIPVTPFYDQETPNQHQKRLESEGKTNGSKMLVQKTDKVIGIRYTPDFYFNADGVDVWIEVKGVENDVFYIKKKLFRKFLDDRLNQTGVRSLFFEIYTKRQLLQALNIIKEYVKSITTD